LLLVAACSSGSDNAKSAANGTSALGTAGTTGRRIVKYHLRDYAAGMQLLRSRGYDIAGVDLRHSRVDVLLEGASPSDFPAHGLTVVREIDAPVMPAAPPTGPGPDYQTPASLEAKLRTLVAAHPTIASMNSIGKSLEGRDIWAVKITSDVATHSANKPVILFNGMHHAREVMSTEVPLDTVEYLLTHYGTDAKTTHWVDSDEIWVVPMFNVDGNNRVWNDDAMWRKNARGCNGAATCDPGTGVDINRNYPYLWAGCDGSSTDPTAEDYHGPSAASEPETRLLMQFVANNRPVFDISYHSYSELVLYPAGCDGQHTPMQDVLSSIGSAMANLLPSDVGSGNYTAGTPWETIYAVDGDDMDWMYNQYKVDTFAIEINGDDAGFQPSYAQYRDKTTTKLRAAWQLLLDRLDQSGIRGVVSGANAANATVTISGGADATETRGVNPDGSFHVVLLPGQYKVTVSSPNAASLTQSVTVGSTRVDLNLTL
jgi:hypothetical protein